MNFNNSNNSLPHSYQFQQYQSYLSNSSPIPTIALNASGNSYDYLSRSLPDASGGIPINDMSGRNLQRKKKKNRSNSFNSNEKRAIQAHKLKSTSLVEVISSFSFPKSKKKQF